MDPTTDQFTLPGIPVPPSTKTVCTFENYKAKVRERYFAGGTYRDALHNWDDFEEHRETCRAWVAHFNRDPWMNINQKCYNQDGTLSSLAWLMQSSIEPDKSKLFPFLDFEEHYQKVFVRRGFIIYLKLLLQEIE